MNRWCALFIALAVTSVAAQSLCPPSPNWSYAAPQDPSHWVEHWPTCGQGHAQSPIDIPSDLPEKPGPAIEFHYQPFDLEVENNSHVIEVPATHGGYIMLAGHRYDLQQFHFHTPSEHHLGGRTYALEIHLVHKDADGKNLVIGILADENAANAALRPITSALPVASCSKKDVPVKFNATALLPAKRTYVSYSGSLTTPACNEGVTWLVLAETVSVSTAQRTALDPFGVDARPLQPLNGRPLVKTGR